MFLLVQVRRQYCDFCCSDFFECYWKLCLDTSWPKKYRSSQNFIRSLNDLFLHSILKVKEHIINCAFFDHFTRLLERHNRQRIFFCLVFEQYIKIKLLHIKQTENKTRIVAKAECWSVYLTQAMKPIHKLLKNSNAQSTNKNHGKREQQF